MSRSNGSILTALVLTPIFVVVLVVYGGKKGSAAEHVWGRRGQLPGELSRPRAITIVQDQLFVVDFTARVQRYDLDGRFTDVSFTTPDFRNGRPSGLDATRDGQLIVCDSHYHCVRIYSPQGQEMQRLGGEPGKQPGQFSYISDCVQDQSGCFYISEFGETDRITKLDREGQLISCWGTSGIEPGQFQRIRAMAISPENLLYVVDTCNHRLQVFSLTGELVRIIGTSGSEPGQFDYPSDVAFDPAGDLYVVERVNARVQKLTREGKPIAMWGSGGRGAGQLADPWALAVDRLGRVHIVDTENHRIQRIRL